MPGSYGSLVKAAERLSIPAEIVAPAHIKTPAKLWMAASHAVPSMESLNLVRQTTPFAGGETEGLSRLQRCPSLPVSPKHCQLSRHAAVLQVHLPGVLDSSVRETQDKSCKICCR